MGTHQFLKCLGKSAEESMMFAAASHSVIDSHGQFGKGPTSASKLKSLFSQFIRSFHPASLFCSPRSLPRCFDNSIVAACFMFPTGMGA